jgi:hypothetical protein
VGAEDSMIIFQISDFRFQIFTDRRLYEKPGLWRQAKKVQKFSTPEQSAILNQKSKMLSVPIGVTTF